MSFSRNRNARKSWTSSLSGSVPSEHDEQKGLIVTCAMHEHRWPELKLIYANPNAGKRTPWEVGQLKEEGWKAGIADLTLPVPRRGYAGLYLELKRSDGKQSDVRAEQQWWIEQLTEQGYRALWRPGAASAWAEIEWYLSGKKTVLTVLDT